MNLPRGRYPKPSEQLNTMHCFPHAFDRSFTWGKKWRRITNDVLYRLCLARPRWTLHAAALDVVESYCEHKEALLGERGHHLVDRQAQIIFSWIFSDHHQSLVASEVLITILKTALNHPEQLNQTYIVPCLLQLSHEPFCLLIS